MSITSHVQLTWSTVPNHGYRVKHWGKLLCYLLIAQGMRLGFLDLQTVPPGMKVLPLFFNTLFWEANVLHGETPMQAQLILCRTGPHKHPFNRMKPIPRKSPDSWDHDDPCSFHLISITHVILSVNALKCTIHPSIYPNLSCLGIFEKSNGVQGIQELATTHQFHQEVHSTPQTIQHFTEILEWTSFHPTWFESSHRVHTVQQFGKSSSQDVLKYS